MALHNNNGIGLAVTVTGRQAKETSRRDGTARQPNQFPSLSLSLRVAVPFPLPFRACGAGALPRPREGGASEPASSPPLPVSPLLLGGVNRQVGRASRQIYQPPLIFQAQAQAEAALQEEAAPRRMRHADAGASGVLVILLRQT
jgi:hypothetical protein